ncbi:MAG: metal ABC transporter ATP-binding protein [Promicromonosporaceae bacterium]|nr:metal ABC transporter ATP-binding protein [Promicromonosporaceae bacterium]
MSLFTAHDLQVRLGSANVLRGINLTINQGEVVAILGANGSGKSTLVRTLVGIQPPTSGSLTAPKPALIGFVPQRASSSGGIPATALEVVASGMLGGRQLRLPRGWRTRATAALAQVGLADRAGEAVIHLSGGQQQRVYIARALVRHPEVLVLDEPVAGVDAASQHQLVEVLAGLVNQGITVVVVLHEIGDFAGLITRTIVLSHGQIAYDGPPSTAITGAGEVAHHDDDAASRDRNLAVHEIGFSQMDSQINLAQHHQEHGEQANP